MKLLSRSPAITGLFHLSICLLFAGCDVGGARVAAKPVVQVNEHQLSAKEFADHLARRLKNFDALSAKDPNNVKRAKEDVIRVFILQTLIEDFAKISDIAIDESELEKEINLFRSSYPDDLSFRRALAEENLSMSNWKEELKQTLISRKVFKKMSERLGQPTDEDVRKYYEENKVTFKRKERIYLRQIILDDLSKAQSVRDELKKRDFIDLAKKYSVAPEAKAGGLVGWIEKGSVDIFDKAFTLPIGGMSQVLESSYGFHIFKVERKTGPGFATLEEVRPEIMQVLIGKKEQAEFASWLDKQIRSSRVLRDNELLSAISVETRGQK
ncbi:MAG: peptidylprolyl isomerase [Pseudobdellovibrionaceae bacterium]